MASNVRKGGELVRLASRATRDVFNRMLRTVSASEISERWQCHGTASAHMMAICFLAANAISLSRRPP